MELPHSDACFLKAYPAETTEAFCDAHVAAFAFFGGVPTSILYDNTRIAVARILGDGQRKRTRVFSELVSHYLFEWGTAGATSWCPSPGSPTLMSSMPIWLNNAANAWMTNCEVRKALLANGLPVMPNGSSPCQLFLMTPATSDLFE